MGKLPFCLGGHTNNRLISKLGMYHMGSGDMDFAFWQNTVLDHPPLSH